MLHQGEEHTRRAVFVSANVTIYKSMQVNPEREEFLRISANKIQFIDFFY